MSSSSSFNFGSDVNYSRWSASRPFLRNEESFWNRKPSAAEAFTQHRYIQQSFKRNKPHESTGVHLPSIFSSATYRSPTVVRSKHLEFDRAYTNEREGRIPSEGKVCKESLLRLVEKAVKQNLNVQKSRSNFGARVRESLGLSQVVNNNNNYKLSTKNIFSDSTRHSLKYTKVQQGSNVIKPSVKNKLSAITILLSSTHSAPTTNATFNKNSLRGRREKRESTETNYNIIGSDSSPVINRGFSLVNGRRQNGSAFPSQHDPVLPTTVGQSSKTPKNENEVESQTRLNPNNTVTAIPKELNTTEISSKTTNVPAEADSNGPLSPPDDIDRRPDPLVSASAGSKGQKAKVNSRSVKRVLSVPKPRGASTRPQRTAVTAGSFRKKEEAKKHDVFENESTAVAAALENGSNVTSATTGDTEHQESGQGVDCAVNVVDQRLVKVLSGELSDLPHLPRHVVRIFTSSTFTGKAH